MPAAKKPASKRSVRRSGGDSTMYKGKAPYGRVEDGSPRTRKGAVARGAEGPKRSMKPKTRELKRVSDYRGTEGPKKSMPRKKTSAKKRTR